ncbi:DUF1579 family protein [Salinispora arenicola]|uniref:Uncharacterized protein DUF1579 n=2 Tax=Salinispora arenicola TaxID=168697 RepID=A0A542XQE8_SALAC|nr:DUF1579 family protein [Salinispora arenicola]TQL38078.1 uncharacterized protein DUF1579 [Salinispora arenicola]GIM86666.1 hypothetical protein Sar04_34020 [Salinispora arenicola]
MTDTPTLPPTDVPPPTQLRALDFLLGHTRCVGETPADGSAPTVMHMYGELTLGGHYLNVDVAWPGTMSGRWIFGWNPIDELINVYYVADSGTQGTATSAGWQDGELTVTGSYAVVEVGGHRMVRDVFRRVDDGHFVINSFVRSSDDERWTPLDVYDCHRV